MVASAAPLVTDELTRRSEPLLDRQHSGDAAQPELSNTFNHPNFHNPSADISAPTSVGRINTVQG